MIKIKINKENLSILINLLAIMEQQICFNLALHRKLTIASMQLKVDIDELNSLISRLKITMIKNQNNLDNKLILITISPVQSFMFVKYQNDLLCSGKIRYTKSILESAIIPVFLNYSSQIHKQLTDLRIK